MPTVTRVVKPPLGGISRVTSFQDQPEFTCYDSLNFWPVDVTDGHSASATRPALTAVTSPGTPVNLLTQLNLPDPHLFAAANGTFYRYVAGAWSAVSSTVGVTGGRAVVAIQYYKQLIILNDGSPAIYDSTANTLVPFVATSGVVPTGCAVGCTYEGAIWMASGNELFSSRVGNIFDWDSSQDDTGAPVDGTFASFGVLTEPITALIPLNGRMIIACGNKMFVMTGHPRQSGRIDLYSGIVGVLGHSAWCRVTQGRDTLFYVTKEGLHMAEVQAQVTDLVTTPVSPKKVPDELIGLPFDITDPTITLAFDIRWNGLILCQRGPTPQAWWYDLDNGGFHRMSFTDYPFVLMQFDPYLGADTSGVMFGGVGYGGLAHFDRTGTETLAAAYQLIGPFPMSAQLSTASRVRRIDHIVGAHTTDLSATIDLHTGRTAQIALYRALANTSYRKGSASIQTLVNTRGVTYPQLVDNAGVIALRQPQLTSARLVFEGSELQVDTGIASNDAGLMAPIISPPSIPLPIGSIKD